MKISFDSIYPDFALTKLQKVAIRRINELQDELAEKGLYVRTGMELEFTVEDSSQRLVRHVLNMSGVREFLKDPRHRLGLLEKFGNDATSDYEVSVGDKAISENVFDPKRFSPIGVAQSINQLKMKTLHEMLQDTTCLNQGIRRSTPPFSPVFRPRPYIASDKDESSSFEFATSSLQVNMSLYNKQGENLFAKNPHLLKHCAAELVDLQDDAGLAMLPRKSSLRRFDKGTHPAVPEGIGMEAIPIDATRRYYSTVAQRGGEFELAKYAPAAKKKDSIINPHDIRLENRMAGADADPFVVMAVTLASVVNTLRDETLDKNQPTVNKYDFPESRDDSVSKFRKSGYAKYVLGDELHYEVLKTYGKPPAALKR